MTNGVPAEQQEQILDGMGGHRQRIHSTNEIEEGGQRFRSLGRRNYPLVAQALR
jgi:hypothetical protein